MVERLFDPATYIQWQKKEIGTQTMLVTKNALKWSLRFHEGYKDKWSAFDLLLENKFLQKKRISHIRSPSFKERKN